MYILRILLLLIILGSGILFLVRKLSISQHLAPFITITGLTALLYVFVLFNFLKPGLYITAGLLLLLGILSFLPWPINKPKEKFIITPSLVAWIVTFFLIAVFTTGLFFSNWDEFDWWGAIYRFLMATNHLPTVASNMLFSTYPPFTALFQYFVGTLVKNAESSAYFAHILLSFSAIIAILPNNKWANWKKYSIALIICILSIFPFDLRFQSIYTDLTLALCFAVGLVSAIFNNNGSRERVITLILTSIALVLTKPLGFVFSVVCIAILFIDLLVKNNQLSSIKTFFKSVFSTLIKPQMLLVITFTLLAVISWNIHTEQFSSSDINLSFNAIPVTSGEIFTEDYSTYIAELQSQDVDYNKNTYVLNRPNSIDISVVNLLRTFTINTPLRTKLIIGNFISSFSKSTFLSIKITCFSILLIIMFITSIIHLIMPTNLRKENLLLRNSIIIFIGFVVYSLAILFAYIYYFAPTSGINTPSLTRYLASYLLGWLLLTICILYQQDSIELPVFHVPASNIVTAMLMFILLFSLPFSAYIHTPKSPEAQRFEVNRIYKAVGAKLTSEDKIYDIWQVDESFGLNHFTMKYFLTPIPSNKYGWKLSTQESDVNRADYLSITSMSADEWLKLLNDQQYTYVLISTSDSVFWQEYGFLFDTYQDNNIPQLFTVTSTGLVSVPIDVKY